MKKYLIFLLFSSAFAQYTSLRPMQEAILNPFGHQLFAYRVYQTADSSMDGLTRVSYYFTLVNDLLTFIKQPDDTYRARYELSLVHYNNKNEEVNYLSKTDTVQVNTFNETNDRQKIIHHFMRFTLEPGDYHYLLKLNDFEGQKIVERTIPLPVKNFKETAISDIVFADSADCDHGLDANFLPNLRNIFDSKSSEFAVYLELYPPQTKDSLEIQYGVNNNTGKPAFDRSKKVAYNAKIAYCLNLREAITKPDDYEFWIRLKASGHTSTAKEEFRVQWSNLRLSSQNLDVAIEQLALIAKGSQIDPMRKANNIKEKQRLYNNFWKQRDPTPDTPDNELQKEFFARIDFANQNFNEPATGRDGWRTDRGRVYVRNGPPDQVDRQSIENGMPASEIWLYARLNQRYIFSDRNGSGEYRLVRVE